MTFDPMGATQVRIMAALENRIAALESQIRTQLGAPVTKASGPLLLPNSSEPSTPTGGVKMYAVGGQFRVIESDGTVRQIPALADVPFPSVTLSDAPGAYNQTWAQDLAESVSSIYQSYIVLLAS